MCTTHRVLLFGVAIALLYIVQSTDAVRLPTAIRGDRQQETRERLESEIHRARTARPTTAGKATQGFAGYINVNETRGHNLFHWSYPSQGNPDTDPVVLWMNGGPGASSSEGQFYENGPWHMNENLTLSYNPYSWNLYATMIFIDQPIGTGWAYSDSPGDELDIHEFGIMSEMYIFLQKWFKQYPQYAKNDFFIFGESYGGHYAPTLSYLVNKGNANLQPGDIHINLRGLGIGDGFVDPLIQFKAYIQFSLQENLIQPAVGDELFKVYKYCEQGIKDKKWIEAAASCNGVAGAILGLNPGMSFYDIRLKCKDPLNHNCYNFTASIEYMNQPEIRQFIGVGNHTWKNPEVPFAILTAINGDEETSYQFTLPSLLASGIRVMAYNGAYDFACNWVGTSEWLKTLNWPGQAEFNNKTLQTWREGILDAGWTKSAQNVTFVKLANAGHMVPMNQPEHAQIMFQKFITDTPF